MPGGLLNLVSYGSQNVILNGNPSKTFFKCTYAKYTNFGLQKFRIDFDGQRTLRMTEPSTFSFKIPRYGDLLMDTFLVVTLPTIWSTILPRTEDVDDNNECPNCYCTEKDNTSSQYTPHCNMPCNKSGHICNSGNCAETGEQCGIHENSLNVETMWCPYEFKWIKNLGTQMMKNVRFIVGGQVIQEYTGDQLYNMVERDFDDAKKDLYYKMTGNVVELHDPANAFGRNNEYPNVWPDTTSEYKTLGPEPSIRARKLYIPLNSWFTLAAKMAFPLVSLQYAEMSIDVEIRPVNELFVVRDIEHAQLVKYDAQGKSVYGPQPHIRPNFNNQLYQFYRFLQPVPTKNNFLDISDLRAADFYDDRRTSWAADVHIISTYAFLTDDEVRVFAEKPQKYLIKEAYQYTYNNVVGSGKVELDSMGMVSNWMWFFRRTDAHLRNEWSNYSNWPYHTLPHNVKGSEAYKGSMTDVPYMGEVGWRDPREFTFLAVPQGPSLGVSNFEMSDYKLSGTFNPENQKDIMLSWAVIMDGKYRENTLDAGVLNYVEKYVRTSGNGQDGLYCYNFGLFSTPDDFQPSGAMNMSKFSKVEFEFSTFSPPLDPNAQTSTICDGDGNIIGINKPVWRIYDYTYDLVVMEERYNILTFESGNAGLMYAR